VTSARIFFVGGLMSYRALFGFISPWVFIPTLVVTPLFQILLFAYIGRAAELESDEFYVIGNALQYASVPALFAMTFTITGERFQQTLGYVLVTPAGRLPLFLGRSLPVIVNAAFVCALSLFLGGLVLGIDVPASAFGPLAVAIVVSTLSCTGLGLVLAGIGLRVREVAVLNNVVFGFLLIFTGANAPLDELPGWIDALGHALPLTHGIEASRLLADGESLGAVKGLLARELGLGLAYGTLGYLFLRFMEDQSRRHATLESS
jgi:ABC-2 type transport system permease protein